MAQSIVKWFEADQLEKNKQLYLNNSIISPIKRKSVFKLASIEMDSLKVT